MSKFSKEKEQEIVDMYSKGLNQVEIANYFNTFNTSIRRVLKRNNVEILSSSERQRKVTPYIFNDYNSKDIQYWLGVIASDGCLTSGKLVVETKDKEWMESYRNFLNPSINVSTTQPPKGNTLYRVQVRCKGLKEELAKYGITENKSLSLEWKYPLTWDFVRGVFDGDGCVTYTEKTKFVIISFCGGSKIFLKQLQDFLLLNNIDSKLVQDNRGLYYLYVHKLDHKKLMYNLMYKDANNFLKRKKDKFSNILNQYYKITLI
jgi:intein-encoded DNA endonuclease-like protein